MQHSQAQAEMMGRATVKEHCPRQEISCTVRILGYMVNSFLRGFFFNFKINPHFLVQAAVFFSRGLDFFLDPYYNQNWLYNNDQIHII
jgi:hypothetical protein